MRNGLRATIIIIAVVLAGAIATIGPLSGVASAAAAVSLSSDASATLAVGGTFSWTHWSTIFWSSLVTLVCAAHNTGTTLVAAYGGTLMATAVTEQGSYNPGMYVGMFYLNLNILQQGPQTVTVKLQAAGGPTDVQCSATTWTGTAGVDTSIANVREAQSGGATSITIGPKRTLPSNEVFFSAVHRLVWACSGCAPSPVSVSGTGATATGVDQNTNAGTGSGYGCQAYPNSPDYDCIASAKLPVGGTSMTYSWPYGAYVVVAGFGIWIAANSGWNGYAGNQAVYMTTGLLSTPASAEYFPQSVSVDVTQSASQNSFRIANAIGMGIGEAANTTLGALKFQEYYVSGSGQLVIDVPMVAVGGGDMSTMFVPTATYSNVPYSQRLSASGAGSTGQNVLTQYNSGINVTGSGYAGTILAQTLGQIYNYTWTLEGFLPYAGWYTGAYDLLKEGTSKVESTINTGAAGSSSAFETFDVINGTWSSLTAGKNVFASQAYFTVTIPYSQFMTPTPLSFEAYNLLRQTTVAGVAPGAPVTTYSYTRGATAYVNVSAVPAVILSGNVTLLGSRWQAATIYLQATSGPDAGTVYQLTTDANGHYRFFARPGTSYTISASVSTAFGTAVGTNSTTTPNAPTIASLSLAMPVSSISGYVKDTSGNPIRGASVGIVEPYPPGTEIMPTTDAQGHYAATVYLKGEYTFYVGATGYTTYTGFLNVTAWNTAYVNNNFMLTASSSGGGGGGCILSGTQITLAGGGSKSVNALQVGDTLLGYDATTGTWIAETVTSNTHSTVSHVLSINNGLLETTLTDQPLFVRNGTWTGWVHDPLNLAVGEQLFVPSTGAWINVTSLQILAGEFKVYDLRVTAPNDYIANKLLVGDKPTPI